MRPYLAHIKSNLRLMYRDRSVLFFSFLFPLVFFFVFSQSFHGAESAGAMSQVITMVLIIGVLGNGFFGAGMRAVQDRETNVLRRFKVAPVGAAPIIVASLVSGLVSYVPLVFVFFLLAKILYNAPIPSNLLSIVVFISIGVVAFRALGMIVAAVVNSAQEMQVITNLLYLPMLFLSGATFPMSMMPVWLQSIAQFLPATYLYSGLQSLMVGGEGFFANLVPVLALVTTIGVAIVIGTKIFRWEKEEKIGARAKLWVLAVLSPFVLMGLYQAHTKQNIERSKILSRTMYRRSSTLLQNVRIFVGNGSVIERGAVLIRNGKIAEVYGTPPENAKSLNAEIVDASGKSVMPGLIDMHVHIGAPGGVYHDAAKYGDPKLASRRLAAYLYSGVTAVRSTGDWLDESLALRNSINSGEKLGAELFICGPVFTAAGGHPEEFIKKIPGPAQDRARAQFLREPKSAGEAQQQVDALKRQGVDGIKAVLDSGNAAWGLFNRLEPGIYAAIITKAAQDGLPSATHTGSAADVREAVSAGTNTVEHGSLSDAIPVAVFAEMKRRQIAYDPTLSVLEALTNARAGDATLLNRSLVQQVGPADMLEDTRAELAKSKRSRSGMTLHLLEIGSANLKLAFQSGVQLITGSDAGNMLVIHGPTVQRELQLWVKAGIPPSAALQAATYNAAKALRADNRLGLVQKDHDASLLLLDGDPVADISVVEHINAVYFKGERIDRPGLFEGD